MTITELTMVHFWLPILVCALWFSVMRRDTKRLAELMFRDEAEDLGINRL